MAGTWLEVRAPWSVDRHSYGPMARSWRALLAVLALTAFCAGCPEAEPVDGASDPAATTLQAESRPKDVPESPGAGTPALPPPPANMIIRLERTACRGGCPDYWLELKANGEMLFDGQAHVVHGGLRWRRIDPDDVSYLFQQFRKAGFMEVPDDRLIRRGGCPGSGCGGDARVTLQVGGLRRTIGDEPCLAPSVGDMAAALAAVIDRVLQTEQWVGTAVEQSALRHARRDPTKENPNAGHNSGGAPLGSTPLGRPNREAIHGALRSLYRRVGVCSEGTDGEHGYAHTWISVDGSTGRVTDVLITGRLADMPVTACISRTIRRQEFPLFDKPTYLVPFTFSI